MPLTPAPVAGSPTQFSLVAGDAATIILDTSGGVLRIVAFAPHPGWFTVLLEQPSATDLRAQLDTGSSQVTFTARLAAGAISAELATGGVTSSVPGTSADGSSTSSPGNTDPDDDGTMTTTTAVRAGAATTPVVVRAPAEHRVRGLLIVALMRWSGR